MGLVTIRVAKFVAVLMCCTIASTILWALFVTDTLYNCTDPGWLDFLSPGHWVHHPVPVAHVIAGRSMSEPDTIKAGWSITGLWLFWFAVVVASVFVSVLLARTPWIREKQAGEIYVHAKAV